MQMMFTTYWVYALARQNGSGSSSRHATIQGTIGCTESSQEADAPRVVCCLLRALCNICCHGVAMRCGLRSMPDAAEVGGHRAGGRRLRVGQLRP